MDGDQEHLYGNSDQHLGISKREKKKKVMRQDVETYRRKKMYEKILLSAKETK